MKVLYLNCNYFTGIRWSKRSYLALGYRYAYLRDKVRDKHIQKLSEIIEREDPDIVCLTEVRSQQLKHIQKHFPHSVDICKYEGTRWSKIPGLKRNRLAILSKEKVDASTGEFERGMKRAFLKFSWEWWEGHFVHLSLGKKRRLSQLEQLRTYIHDRAFFIGDFNTLSKEEQGLCPIERKPSIHRLSFPAAKARKSLDHCIGQICRDIRYFDSEISDHLGMIFHLGHPSVA